MNLTEKEVQMLQEQFILVYKVIHQDNTFKSFYYKDIDVKNPKSTSTLINELNKLENAEELLKNAIIELEEIKEKIDLKNETFYKIIEKYDLRELKEKYFIKKPIDLDELDIKILLKSL